MQIRQGRRRKKDKDDEKDGVEGERGRDGRSAMTASRGSITPQQILQMLTTTHASVFRVDPRLPKVQFKI